MRGTFQFYSNNLLIYTVDLKMFDSFQPLHNRRFVTTQKCSIDGLNKRMIRDQLCLEYLIIDLDVCSKRQLHYYDSLSPHAKIVALFYALQLLTFGELQFA